MKKWIVVIETLGRGIDGVRDCAGDIVIDRVAFPHRALGAATRHLASILYQRKFPLAHRFYVVHTDRPDQHYALNTARKNMLFKCPGCQLHRLDYRESGWCKRCHDAGVPDIFSQKRST